jgi:23S rRNA pseudouridine1911/1915/1917 synthase
MIHVSASLQDKTLAAALREASGEGHELAEALSWNAAKRMCRTGKVFVDGERELDPSRRLETGSTIEVRHSAPRPKPGTLEPERLVHVDRDVVVVRKPADVLSVPYDESDRDTLVDQTASLLRKRRKQSGSRYAPELIVVHRLDKGTSGLLAFARTAAARRGLAQQFRFHTVDRRYEALVHGHPASKTHDTHLLSDRGDGLRGSFGVYRTARGGPPKEARRAITHVELLERLRGAARVECRLQTGRQHQIRIHMSEDGHPVVGEPVYMREYEGPVIEAPRPMLHARHLGFEHPRTGEWLEFDDPPPEDFAALCDALRG